MTQNGSRLESLIADYFQTSGTELCIGHTRTSDVVGRYGTPLYVYDRQILERKLSLLRNTLPPRFAINYSVKANPNRKIIQYFISQGCGLEVGSGGELYQALRAGCPPEKVDFAGPGKTEPELEFALTQGIHEVHVESMLEIERVSSISRKLGLQSRIAVRLNPSSKVQGGAMRMGSKPAPFGIDEECLDAVLECVMSDRALILNGVHFFIGTQILDHEILINQFRNGLEIGCRIATYLHRPLQTLDFGGGFGVPYFAHESDLDLGNLQHGLAELMTEFADEPAFAGTQFLVEPGRFLVAEAGIYIVSVNDIKVSRGKKFLVTDGGMHHHLAASGNLGQTFKRNYPVAMLNKLSFPAEETVDVVGPLCTPLDVLARELALPRAEVGDLIGIFLSGAYARSASPLGFLSHPAPPEVWIEEGTTYLTRRRGTYEDNEFGYELR